MPILCLRLLSDARSEEGGWSLAAEWLIREDDGAVRGQGVTDYRGLGDLLDPAQVWLRNRDSVIVLVPHDQVLELNVVVPGRSAAQMRRALPYAVEEYASSDIENLHIAADLIRPGQPVRTQLIDRGLVDNWLDCLRSLGIEPGFLLVDTELLETGEGQTTVLMNGSEALLRTPTEAATVDRANLLMVLQALAPVRLRVVNGELDALEEAQLPATSIDYIDTGESCIEYLVDHWRPGLGMNLLQGAYTPARTAAAASSAWVRLGFIAAGWAALAWTLMLAEALWAGHRAEALQAEGAALFASWFPDAGPVRNPRRALAERLGQSAGDGAPGFAQLTADLAGALESSANLRSLEYDQQDGELRAEIILESHAAVESLRVRLGSSGIDAQLLNATQEESSIRALLVLRRAA